MRSKFAAGFLIFLVTSISMAAQSVYQLQYNFHLADDTITYHAFLVRFDDGSGLLRIRYLGPKTNEDVLIETDLDEDYKMDQAGMADTNILVLKSVNPRYIAGSDKSGFNAPLFIFKNNQGSGFFEPTGVVRSQQESTLSPNRSE